MSAFTKAIVVDVLADPSTITDEYATQLQQDISNLRDSIINVKNFPRNSLIVRCIHGNQSQVASLNEQEIVLPFFSPHICPPIKPGEAVWIFRYDPNSSDSQMMAGLSPERQVHAPPASLAQSEQQQKFNTFGSKKSSIGYWISRVATFMQYDDINYTVFSRAYELQMGENPEYEGADKNQTPGVGEYFRTAPGDSNEPNVPSLFINGAGKPPQPEAIQPREEFKNIFDNATANGIFEFEPVPRFTKRPGDFVIQGSNNTLISLGSDRTSAPGILNNDQSGLHFPLLSGSEESKIEEDFTQYAGTIDLVAGRGRILPSSAKADPKLTSPRIINTDGKRGSNGSVIIENDKDPQRSERDPNPNEGNPDFVLDSSRMYVSMRTNGDKNFALPQPPITDNSPTGSYNPKGAKVDPELLSHIPTSADGAAFIITKSDEIRIIARKNNDLKINPESDASVNGSIKIVKEGKVGEDLAMIIMHPDGTVQIDAPRIILGRNDAGPFDDGSQPGSDQETGYVKFSQYNKQMSNLHDEVYTLANAVIKGFEICDSRWESLATTLASKTNSPGFGAPVPGLVAAGAEMLASWITGANLGLQITPNSPAEIAGKVKDDIDADDVGLPGTGESGLKGKIPDARSDTIFGE